MNTRLRRPQMRRAVVLSPNGLTLANLFFGIWAIIAASRGQFERAGLYVILGGIADAFDGRVARAVGAGGRFGEELDSLVDAITFGLAPSLIMYFAVLNREGPDWIWSFVFTACAVLRLARFNVVQAGTSKRFFQGLPSPAAGITLASYYWFSQSQLFQTHFIGWKWQELMRVVMGVLAFLMISPVPYPAVPKLGWKSIEGWIGVIFLVGGLSILFTGRWEYFFPLAVAYVASGFIRAVILGAVERSPRKRREEGGFDAEGMFEDSIPIEDLDEAYEDDIEYERDEVETPQERQDRQDRQDRLDRKARRERRERRERGERGERGERTERTDRPKRSARPARPLVPPAISPAVVASTAPDAGEAIEGDAGGLDGGLGAAAKRRRRRRRPRGDRPDGGSSPSTPSTPDSE